MTSPAAPADVKTNEELYLIGLRAEQFHDPNIDPDALSGRKPCAAIRATARVNTALGITPSRKAGTQKPSSYFRKALDAAHRPVHVAQRWRGRSTISAPR